jgi:hypothetical protein
MKAETTSTREALIIPDSRLPLYWEALRLADRFRPGCAPGPVLGARPGPFEVGLDAASERGSAGIRPSGLPVPETSREPTRVFSKFFGTLGRLISYSDKRTL